MTRHDPTVSQYCAQVGGGRALPRVRAECLEIGGEHPIGAELTFHTHGGGDVRGLEQAVEIGEREHQHAEHAIGAVDQRKAFLLGQHDRLEPGGFECFASIAQGAGGVADLALTHHGEGHVRQRSQVA